MAPKKKSAFSHPELTLLPLCRIVAQGGRDKEIDAYCRSVGAKDWPDLFNRYPKFNETSIRNGGSSNHPAGNSAVGLCHSATRDQAIESWSRAAEMESSTVGFELNEPGSRLDYKTWSLIGRLIGYLELGGKWRNGYFDKWLELYTRLELLSTVKLEDGPFSLRCGARSQGVFNRTKADYFIAKVMGEKWSWRSKPHLLPDKAWAKSDEIIVIDSMNDVIDKIGTSTQWLDQDITWPTLNPTHYYKTTGGLAVWCERADLNSNTPGISAMVYYFDEKRLVTAPSPSRDHIRQKKVPQMVHFYKESRVLHFEQLHPGRAERLEIPLPSGDLVYYVYHGPNGLETRS